ncbi:hypothetical protein ILP92_17080 [Maribius pontilimi]|uniref:Uncharacterized protein n=1 Tax=Palleronia pontilimi TaxID=1964209 RepID=A0A934IHH2_9RHOB|nr:hypothetical protein [Palleronia pontilimi]MBJ3764452.1 hypothetical protein [Palleronia pontilimi]
MPTSVRSRRGRQSGDEPVSRLRVDALKLSLRAPEARRAEARALQIAAEERFMPAVLQALHRRLAAAYGPEAVIRIARLRLRLSMAMAGLGPGALAEQIGQDLAARIEAALPRLGRTSWVQTRDATVQLFRSRADLQAVALVAAAQRRPGPEGTRQDFAPLWRALLARPAAARARVLAASAEESGLQAVLARLGPVDLPTLDALAAARPPPAVLAELRRAQARVAAAAAGQGTAPALADPSPPEVPPVPVAPPGAEPSAPRPRTGPGSPPIAEPANAPTPPAAADDPAVPPEPGPTAPPAGAPSDPAGTDLPPPGAPVPPAAAPVPADAAGAPSPLGPGAPRPAPAAASSEPEALATEWGGLPYLLNITLRLELPERLWRIGLDEGTVIAAMLARIAGTAEDPAWDLLRPDYPAPARPPPPLADWARAELVSETEAEAEARATGDGLGARIADLAAWYAEGPSWELPAWGAALHLAVLEDLLGAHAGPQALAERLRLRGKILDGDETVRILLPLDSIDPELRRLGLDADPGYLPWLGKRLVFDFVEAGP